MKNDVQLVRLVPTINFRTAYGPKPKVQLSFPAGEGRTKQSFKDECDINVIMRRYQQTGVLEHVQKAAAQYADVTGQDFQDAMDIIANAKTAFEELPAAIRDRFDNDPAEFLDFVHDPENQAEAGELGLLSPEGMADLAEKAKSAEASPAATPQRRSGDRKSVENVVQPAVDAVKPLGDQQKPAGK